MARPNQIPAIAPAKNRLHILVVDDNRSAADALARVLRKGGDQVDAVYDGAEAIQRIKRERLDLVLTDLKMEPVDGMAVLEAARALQPAPEVIVFTAYGAVDVAVAAMRRGARDFLTKPVTAEQVAHRLDQLRRETWGALPTPEEHSRFIAVSPASKELLATLERVAGVPSPVWIEGEVGSGRVFAAETLHRAGAADAPFVIRDARSAAPWPSSGTVVLPNVDDLPLEVQRELHTALQHAPSDIRLIATANANGRQRVADGLLRADLYYKLAVVVIGVPPLRERVEDILPLFHHGLALYSQRYHRELPQVPAHKLANLEHHAWPGNLRELLNLAERTVVLGPEAAETSITERSSSDLPALEPGFSLSDYLEEVERRILVDALRRCGGDRTQAGRLLGVERNTLRYKLNKYGLLDR